MASPEAQVAVAAAASTAASTNVGSEDQEALHGWHLSKKEAEHVTEIADMYKHMGIMPYPHEIAPFKIEQSHGMLSGIVGNYYRAAIPVTHGDIHMPDHHDIGFLGKEANSLSVSLRNYKLTQIHEEHPGDRHSASSLVVNEFHHFVKRLATLMNPTDETLTEISQRVGLIETFITRCHISMHKYRPFLSIMVKVKEQLQQILSIWPAFKTQQKLQEQIRAVKLHVDAALLRLLGYCFYVLKCEPGEFDFDPQDWHPAIQETESVHFKIMHWLMLQENVYDACTNHSVDRNVWMKQLMATGYEGDILHQMNEAWTDPNAMSEPVLQLGDMRGDESGLPSNVFAEETDMSPDQRRTAIQLWLTLVREAVGFAMGAKMMDHAYTLSCLGGELLIAKKTSKDLALSTLKFVRNRLAEVTQTMMSLDRIMLPVLAKGKMKNSENYLWNNRAFVNWSRNYEYAKTHCAPGIVTHAHEARQTIVELESEIADLDVAQVEKKIGDVGKSLISLCKSSCQLFNEPHSLTVDELPPMAELEDATPTDGKKELQIKTASPSGPSVRPCLAALQNQLDREETCLQSSGSLCSVGYLSSRSWIPAAVAQLAPTSGHELAKYIIRVTLEGPDPYAPRAPATPMPFNSMDSIEPFEDATDTKVVEFWRRVRFEDIAEVVQFISPEPILSVAAGGLGSVLGIEHFGDVLRNLTENDEKAQRASLNGLLALPRRERLKGVRRCLGELEEDLLQRIPPGHAQTLTRELALALDPAARTQSLSAGSVGFPTSPSAKEAKRKTPTSGLVTLVRLDLDLQVSGRCCVNARLNWSAQLTVLTLPSLKELVARVCAKSKSQDVLKGKSDSESQEYQQRLQEELFAFISSGTDLMRKRFSPSHYPEVQQWLREGYTVRSVQATPVQGEECSVS
ncbi:hypothetical protein AK812_SmicGene39380 [Symbiodinium microadriaticum]|uniref:Uncharacterized protein n=2 Tax=Symbiodinium TaxID=2949 RepID=A0A1Q9CBM7_SYMMI|nr:hypothetical protein AK812_SmicGene39380 [Symbiodinium microadriaticum]